MKRLFFPTVLFLLIGSFASAQNDEIQVVQKEWGQSKKELVSLAMDLSAADSAKFWPLYSNYEKERQKLGRDRIVILTEYSDNFESLTSAKADDLVMRIFKNDLALTNLQQRYYTSFKTKIGALKAAKFMQIESYINTSIRSVIQEELPFIGELDSMKKQ